MSTGARRTARVAMAIGFAAALQSAAALAAGGGGGSSMPEWPSDPVLQRFDAAVERRDWTTAEAIARDAVAASPANAEYHNRLAFAIRSGAAPRMDLVFKHYNEALRLEPEHRGAHEYLGEAYLMVGNVAKAKEHLGVLDRLCGFGCDEYTKLKNAIAAREVGRK